MIADDLGHNDLGIHGAEWETPNLDELFTEGLNFTNYYVQCTCSPSRVALMTGRYPFRMGVQSMMTFPPGTTAHIPLSEKTWAEQLKQVGYNTHYIGKWHLGYASWDYTPTHRGFDSYTGYMQGGQDYYLHNLSMKVGDEHYNGFDFWHNTTLVPDVKGLYSNDLFLGRALEILDAAQEPFALEVAFQEVHAPLESPSPGRNTSHCESDTSYLPRRTYCRMASVLDESVGLIISKLKAKGLYDNTLIVFTTDNGGMPENDFISIIAWLKGTNIASSVGSNYPFRAGKGTLFEGGMRGVAVLSGGRLPDKLRGTTTSALHHAVDMPVTVMQLAGATIPAKVDGIDIFSEAVHDELLLDIEPARTNKIPMPSTHSARKGDMKYIRFLPLYDGWYKEGHLVEDKPWLKDCIIGCVFNVTADPYEKENLFDTADGQKVARELKATIQEVIDGGDYIDVQTGFFDHCAGAINSEIVWAPWIESGEQFGCDTVVGVPEEPEEFWFEM